MQYKLIMLVVVLVALEVELRVAWEAVVEAAVLQDLPNSEEAESFEAAVETLASHFQVGHSMTEGEVVAPLVLCSLTYQASEEGREVEDQIRPLVVGALEA